MDHAFGVCRRVRSFEFEKKTMNQFIRLALATAVALTFTAPALADPSDDRGDCWRYVGFLYTAAAGAASVRARCKRIHRLAPQGRLGTGSD